LNKNSPTFKLIYPSQVVIQKTGGFGLGHATVEELALVENTLTDDKKKFKKWEKERWDHMTPDEREEGERI
jgi:hypothetical protein